MKESNEKQFAIGVSDFKELIIHNSAYIDKSLFIKAVIDDPGQVSLIIRPRRFGKTLNMSMLNYFFNVLHSKEKQLFAKLKIANAISNNGNNCLDYQGKYPTIYLSFLNVGADNFNEMKEQFKFLISQLFMEYKEILFNGCLKPKETEKEEYLKIVSRKGDDNLLVNSLQILMRHLYEQYNENVILLIDEYDTPTDVSYSYKYYDKAIEFVRLLLNSVLKDNNRLERCIMTGILKITNEQIFSGLNNVLLYSVLDDRRYSKYFGFTDEEILQLFDKHLSQEQLSQLKSWYSGYRVGPTIVYNPWSVINFYQRKNFDCYWLNTGGDGLIVDVLSHVKANSPSLYLWIMKLFSQLKEKGTILQSLDQNTIFSNIEVNEKMILGLLVLTGYLTTKAMGVDNNYEILIPNNEAYEFYKENYPEWFGKIEESINSFEKQADKLTGPKRIEPNLNDVKVRDVIITNQYNYQIINHKELLMDSLNKIRRNFFKETLMRLSGLIMSLTIKPKFYILIVRDEPKSIKKVVKTLKQDLEELWGEQQIICPLLGIEPGDSISSYVSQMEQCNIIIVLCTPLFKQAYEALQSNTLQQTELSLLIEQLHLQKSKIIPCYIENPNNIPFFLTDIKPASLLSEKDYQRFIFHLLKQANKNESKQLKEAIRIEQEKLEQAYKASKEFLNEKQQVILNELQLRKATKGREKDKGNYEQVVEIPNTKVSLPETSDKASKFPLLDHSSQKLMQDIGSAAQTTKEPKVLSFAQVSSFINAKTARFAVGESDFLNVVISGHRFVDKSLLIQAILDDASKIKLLIRPRRFGKTFNMKMLEAFFSKQLAPNTRSVFQTLKIWQAGEKYQVLQGQYPVIFITFKDIKSNSFAEAYDEFKNLMSKLYMEHEDKLLPESLLKPREKEIYIAIINEKANEVQVKNSLKDLTAYLHRYYQKSVIVLIDEYDTPIHASYTNSYYSQMAKFMHTFLSAALKDNSHLEQGILTGILRVAKESIFSGLNNLRVYSVLSEQYGPHFGFTIEEVRALLGKDADEKLAQVEAWYGGYRAGSTQLYNPWSIANYIEDSQAGFKPYWINTSENTLITDLLKRADGTIKSACKDLVENRSLVITIDEHISLQDIEAESHALWSFLLLSGYLTPYWDPKDILESNRYRLFIPNQEIYQFYRKLVVRWFGENNLWVFNNPYQLYQTAMLQNEFVTRTSIKTMDDNKIKLTEQTYEQLGDNKIFSSSEQATAEQKNIQEIRLIRSLLQDQSEIFQALVQNINVKDAKVWQEVAAALGKLGKADIPEVVFALIQKIRDKDAGVRRAAMEALIKLGKADTPEVVSALIQNLSDNDPRVRRAAVEALIKLEKAEAPKVVQALIKDLSDKDARVRRAAVGTLGKLEKANAPEVVAALLQNLSDEDARVRQGAAAALKRLDRSDILKLNRSLISDPEEKTHQNTVHNPSPNNSSMPSSHTDILSKMQNSQPKEESKLSSNPLVLHKLDQEQIQRYYEELERKALSQSKEINISSFADELIYPSENDEEEDSDSCSSLEP